MMLTLIFLLFLSARVGCLAEDVQVPHVLTCNLCQKCYLGAVPPAGFVFLPYERDSPHAKNVSRVQREHFTQIISRRLNPPSRVVYESFCNLSSFSFPSNYSGLYGTVDVPVNAPKQFSPDYEHLPVPKFQLPNCTQCYGCSHELEPIKSYNSTFMGIPVVNEGGATSSFLYKTKSNRSRTGYAIVKVGCMPFTKARHGRQAPCRSTQTYLTSLMLLAINDLSRDCGFDDIVPPVWVEKVNAIDPQTGFHISWNATWIEHVDGISLSNMNSVMPYRLGPDAHLNFYRTRMNHTQIVRAALFDLLTSQCDRHSQNVFVQEDGHIWLIDNEVSLQVFGGTCAFDSIFLPSCQKQETLRVSNAVLLKQVPINRVTPSVEVSLFMDYRCFVEGGEIGTNYPPKMQQCLRKISGMSVQDLQRHYNLPTGRAALTLSTRATDLLARGFEWTYRFGHPQNRPARRYRVQEPCCKVEYIRQVSFFACQRPGWKIFTDLPRGNPLSGAAIWDKPHLDTNVYDCAEDPPKPGSVQVMDDVVGILRERNRNQLAFLKAQGRPPPSPVTHSKAGAAPPSDSFVATVL